nr:Autophagy-related protein [Ipomoea batatas]
MALRNAMLRNLRSHSLFTVHKLQNPIAPSHLISSDFDQTLRLSVISRRPLSISETKVDTASENIDVSSGQKQNKKPLDIFFKEAVGILETRRGTEDIEENGDLRSKLRKLEEEVRVLQEKRKKEIEEKNKQREREAEEIKKAIRADEDTVNNSKPKSLHELFANELTKKGKSLKTSQASMEEDLMVGKGLSPDMVMLVTHLYEEGYFKDANFLRKNRFDITCFEDSYARHYIKYAAEEFANDNQGVAKWLSGSDLKKVALFGCPSLVKKHVYSAKMLRNFFRIQEDTVCGKCALRDSCKFVNQHMWNGNAKTLQLHHVMRTITLYGLESVPTELVVPEDIKKSVGQLLKEVVKLSKVC